MKRLLVIAFAILMACAFVTGSLAPTPASAEKKQTDSEKEKVKKEAAQKAKEAMKKAQEDKAKAKAGTLKTEKPKKDTGPVGDLKGEVSN
jgi:DNA integrity scanning protein DisA with diadenylate cyclase activity